MRLALIACEQRKSSTLQLRRCGLQYIAILPSLSILIAELILSLRLDCGFAWHSLKAPNLKPALVKFSGPAVFVTAKECYWGLGSFLVEVAS